uniref:Uncharacterized protein n=1 Tax=Sphaerodactylus townsendi TaxID=933632 RepID=A0ACB8EAK4_9SAUR
MEATRAPPSSPDSEEGEDMLHAFSTRQEQRIMQQGRERLMKRSSQSASHETPEEDSEHFSRNLRRQIQILQDPTFPNSFDVGKYFQPLSPKAIVSFGPQGLP